MTVSNYNIEANNGYIVKFPRNNDGNYSLHTNYANPYAQSADQLFPLGSMLEDCDRRWVYCKAGAGIGIGIPVQSAEAVHDEQDDDIVTGAVAAIGATAIELTSTDNLDGSPNDEANDFAEGYVIVNDEAGEGQLRKIISNDAFDDAESDCTFNLYDALLVALSTSSQCGLIRSPYYRVLATKAVVTGKVIGVPLLGITSAYYFWCQCAGLAPLDMNAAVSLGTKVVVGTTAASADPASCDTTEITIGEMVTPGITGGEYAIVFLRLGF